MYDKSYWSDHFMDYANEDEEDDEEEEDAGYRSVLPSHTTSSDPDDPTRVFDGHPWPFYHEADPDETPRPEDDSSLAGILRNALLKTAPQLPVAGREGNLPPNPKLQVDGVGSVTLPLTDEQTLRLITRCELESNHKTEGKVYELDGKHVKLDDFEWERSLDKLAEVVRSHLGLGRVGEDHEQVLAEPMHKLVLYDQGDVVLDGGAGGSAEKAAEATLIVPFSSSGGEVVVVETPGGVKTRHELTQIGSQKGENFIVVSSGSRCTVEGAQSGVRAALIFSFHVEESLAYLSSRTRDQDVRDVLAPALEASGELDPIVLLLKNDYDSNVLAESGASALTGVDLARIQTIEKLNAVLPVNKKLQFFAVRLEHEIESVCTGDSDYDDGLEKEHKDSIVWYTIGTKDQTFSRDPYTDEDLHLEYLNPDDENLRDMWLGAEPTSNVTMPSDEDNKRFVARMRSGGYEEYDDPPTPTKHDRYFRHGVIILPRERAMEVIRKFSGNDAAAAYLQQYPTRDSAALRSLLTNGDYDTKEWNDAVCHSLVEMNDASLVHLFFEQVANIFCTANRVDISSAVPILVRGFGWEVIETPFLTCYASHSVYEHEVLEVLVHLANAFSDHDDQKRILESLLHEAKFWNPFYISSDYYKIELLWSCASHCSDITVFERFVILLKRSGPDCYGSMIQRLEKYSDEVGFSPRERVAFSDFVAARVHYLKAAVTNRGKPGEWSIPRACVPGEPEVEKFLRGPQRSKEFTGFPDKKAARVFMSRFTDDNCASMFSMECGRDRKFAIMTKTVTLTKHSHKHAPGDGFHLDLDEQLLKLMKKYYPDEDRSWIRETWAKQAPKSPKRFQQEQEPRSQKEEPKMSDDDFAKGKWPFGGEGEPDDVPVPSGTAAQISDVLARADEQAGEYSFGGQADSLPAAPGLIVNEVGSIPVPITAEQAEKLIEKCKKSPFGHNFETKMDEAVRQSWQLEPTEVRFENMAWQSGLEKLRDAIADRLGYEGIPLQCVLYKLLVYGEGGHFVKHQDTEKEDGMIATLVIQLPSSHEGGDLVVYRGGEERHRHDFGKADGTSAFLPHYAVHYADAEHALEKVTKGYRLALVYSICLPSTMHQLEKAHDRPLSEDLASLIGNMEDDEEPFALLLAHEYTAKSIQDLGIGALKGVDSARVHALEEANALVPTAKQLRLFIVHLAHKIEYDMDRSMNWEPGERTESIHWYCISGESLGRTRKSTAFNFLNPGQETLSQLWAPHGIMKEDGYMGNEGPTRNTKYARYAIVAWPSVKHAQHALKVMPFDVAMENFYTQKPVDAATLRAFMKDIGARLKVEGEYSYTPAVLSIKFCRLFCELAVETGDPEIVRNFFTNTDYYINKPRNNQETWAYCWGLEKRKDNDALIPVITKIARTFDWKDFGDALVSCLGISTYAPIEEDTGYSRMEMALLILDGLDTGAAQDALLKMALEKSAKLTTEELCSSKVVGLILKWVVRRNSNPTVDKVADLFGQLGPSLLSPALLENSLEGFDGVVANYQKADLLTLLISKRIDWLKNQIDGLDKPFSWEMLDAQFPDNALVEEFLRGPATTMTMAKGVHKFKGFQDASNCAAKWMREAQINASFKMKASATNANASVTITKTRKWFAESQQKLGQYKVELAQLLKYAGGETNYGDKKRARLE